MDAGRLCLPDSNAFLKRQLSRAASCTYDGAVAAKKKMCGNSCRRGWRIAVLIRGSEQAACNEHLDRFLFQLPNADIFFHHWSDTAEREAALIERYSPTRHVFEASQITAPVERMYGPFPGAPRQIDSHAHMFRGVSRVHQLLRDYEAETKMLYDMVVNVRWDIGVGHVFPIVFPWVCPDTSYLYSAYGPEANFAWYDMWWFGNSRNCSVFCDLYSWLEEGRFYPRRHGPNRTGFTDMLDNGIPFSEKGHPYSNVVLSNRTDYTLADKSDQEHLLHNVHLLLKYFLLKHDLVRRDRARYCVNKAYADEWSRRFSGGPLMHWPWSLNPKDVQPNCIANDTYDVNQGRGRVG